MTNSETPESRRGPDWRWFVTKFGPIIGLVFVWCLFAICEPLVKGRHDFATTSNSIRILLDTAVVGTAAIGATLIIISAGIDLSVAGTIALGTMVIASVLNVSSYVTGPNRGDWASGTAYASGDVIQRLKRAGGKNQTAEYRFYVALKDHTAAEKSELIETDRWLEVTVPAADAGSEQMPVPGEGSVQYRLTMTHRWPIFWPLVAALSGVFTGVIVGLTIGSMVIGRVGRAAAALLSFTLVLWLWSYSWWIALAGGAAAGGLVLVWAEKSLGRLPLSPFIVTLGLWGALRGVAKGIGDNQPIYPVYRHNWLEDLMLKHETDFLVPTGVWIMLVVAVLAAAMLRYTRLGRHIYAIGSNEETARLCGVHVERTKLMIYMIAIGCAGLASVLQFSYITMGDPTTAPGYELRVIAAAVIGGASLSGGVGTILGTLTGALIMTVVDSGCNKLGLENWRQDIVTGAIIVAAVALDEWRKRRAT